MKAKYHAAHKIPTETQKKFFERNKLTLPPKARIAEDIIQFIMEEEGEKYLQRIDSVRYLQTTLIGTTLDTGETIQYIVCLPLTRRKREGRGHTSVFFAGIRGKNGNLFQRRFEYCVKDGSPLVEKRERYPGVDWGRYWLFGQRLLDDVVVRLSQGLFETDPKWAFSKDHNGFKVWIDPREVSIKRARATMEHSTEENGASCSTHI
ncbi:MAG: hypothetical protein COV91_02715 [Candidatus Taylorbacteria bacterium CG11_big_fil_rev_8_21_14_0_20_46_11]|uniref:Uncharacterized protein n=1 Tax=Candidatus Taylorbacteria bacterium CG11_big_fil_rev_8_21_14_0_20_46_11 TaxID=1975025 RepID=A0A2H0KBR3_9BACT|nr:MAG: hypothetical protein COV91_02715 [Candidatus Taylorbacteria bacterium CG11_big_fil_rev_8_21_14_0_20_46_11]